MTEGYTNVSFPAVHKDMALELMAHHLQLAHTFYQNIPDDRAANRAELFRLLQAQYHMTRWVDDGGMGHNEIVPYFDDAPEIVAGLAWLDKMEELYAGTFDND